jgi:hypothetical protein
MKFSTLFILASIASVSNALVPSSTRANVATPVAPTGRRVFLAQASAVSAAALVGAAAPAFAKDVYSLDVEKTVVPKKVAENKGGGGGLAVGGALAAGVALSLPFFYQNLARMGGVKNAKLPVKGAKPAPKKAAAKVVVAKKTAAKPAAPAAGLASSFPYFLTMGGGKNGKMPLNGVKPAPKKVAAKVVAKKTAAKPAPAAGVASSFPFFSGMGGVKNGAKPAPKKAAATVVAKKTAVKPAPKKASLFGMKR